MIKNKNLILVKNFLFVAWKLPPQKSRILQKPFILKCLFHNSINKSNLITSQILKCSYFK